MLLCYIYLTCVYTYPQCAIAMHLTSLQVSSLPPPPKVLPTKFLGAVVVTAAPCYTAAAAADVGLRLRNHCARTNIQSNLVNFFLFLFRLRVPPGPIQRRRRRVVSVCVQWPEGKINGRRRLCRTDSDFHSVTFTFGCSVRSVFVRV